MTNANRLRIAWKALLELGPGPLTQYALYQLNLRSGLLRWRTPGYRMAVDKDQGASPSFQPAYSIPTPDQIAGVLGDHALALLAEADEICAGQIRLFGGAPRPLQLALEPPFEHWTKYSPDRQPGGPEDIKLIWEPGRFGWAVTLARAYHLTHDIRYARVFWAHTESFLASNPPNLGPHWISAQEVAIRLIALAFALHVFHDKPEAIPERRDRLQRALVTHAARLPPTLSYARAQGNNHLLSEAAGLYTAGVLLPSHPEAERWRSLGWRWFHLGLQDQIAPDGAYVQQSANYHRLMLQLALWVAFLATNQGEKFPPESCQRLAAATRWLNALVDPATGQTPNLGPNDGGRLLPLAGGQPRDFRPTLAAAGRAFLGEALYPPGPWQEAGLWLGWHPESGAQQPGQSPANTPRRTPSILKNPISDSWGYLRAARFTRRPGHADQLHFDLWWRGVNLALDPGTYHYNAAPPWENALAGTDVHNTVTVNDQDQMSRAGRFLWLDWAQAEMTSPAETRLIARHDGYHRFGVTHQRTVVALENGGWIVEDDLLPITPSRATPRQVRVRLHWLLLDRPWEIQPVDRGVRLELQGPPGRVQLTVQTSSGTPPNVTLVRAGKRLFGEEPVRPYWGWHAPTYAHKEPALSFAISSTRSAPFRLVTEWHLESD